MRAKRKSAAKTIVQQPVAQSYARSLAGIKQRIRTAQVKAALAANAELVLHYWEIGDTLRDVKSPMGVAEYRLLPAKLKTKLPPVSQLKDGVASLDVPKS